MIHTVPSYEDALALHLHENDGIIITGNTKKKALYRFVNNELVPIQFDARSAVKGMTPEQHIFLDIVRDPDIPVINLYGPPGCGKSFCSIGAGLEGLMKGQYRKLMIIREMVPATKFRVGFLPGSFDEKVDPMFAAVYDTAEALGNTKLFKNDIGEELQQMRDNEMLEFTTLETMRGRNLRECFVICDDAQNLDVDNIRLIITRMSEGSRIIFNGDPEQIDNNYVLKTGMGMNYVHQVCYGHSEYAHVNFTQSSCRSKFLAKFLEWERAAKGENG